MHLPATASLRTLVRLTHQRWAIEQQYQELKDELGLDHFEGRSFAGWQRHVVLTALAYTWLQCERQRRGTHQPTLPVVRAVITEILTAHFFVTRPHYLRTMQKLADIDLRIAPVPILILFAVVFGGARLLFASQATMRRRRLPWELSFHLRPRLGAVKPLLG